MRFLLDDDGNEDRGNVSSWGGEESLQRVLNEAKATNNTFQYYYYMNNYYYIMNWLWNIIILLFIIM